MRFCRGLLAAALAASLGGVWAQPAQASPSIVISVSQWAYANTGNATTSANDGFIGPGDPAPAAPVMRVGNDTTGNLHRGFMRFSLNGVSGQVLEARLIGRVDHTWSCTARPSSFHRTAPIAATPRQAWPGPALQLGLGIKSLNANESTCGQPNAAFALETVALLNDVRAAVNAHQPAYYVGVSAGDLGSGANEAAYDRWMRYFLNDFKLQVVFGP